MDHYSKTFEIRWADIDPNRHMRHTAYNDYAAQARVGIFNDLGLTMEDIAKMGLGPILFREETKFFREVNLFEKITVNCLVKGMRKDGSKWSILHEIYKEDGVKAAGITVDGAWLDLKNRKIGKPTTGLLDVMLQFPRAEDFEWLPESNKKMA